MSAPTLAVDFGTSNSAAAVYMDGTVQRLPLEGGADTLPTAVFLPAEGGQMLIGRAAEQALITGEDGRYLRALKSILGTPLFHETRLLSGKRRALSEIVTAFLKDLKARAEAASGISFTRVLSGRPVHFYTSDPDRDILAEEDLRACYHAAGFTTVDFMFEPEAAALARQDTPATAELRLIVDIGGGTSDFSVVRVDHSGVEVIASHGIRLGGTDFDHAVSMAHAMPSLGLGGALRRTFGEGLLPIPRAVFTEISTWALIPFAYTRDTERLVEDLLRHAVELKPLQRLESVIKDRLGHDLAFAVERGKIAANAAEPGAAIDMSLIERGLRLPLSTGALNAALAHLREPLRIAIYETLFRAHLSPAEIGAVVLVGGSSLMRLIEQEARAACPAARVIKSDAFTSVVDGLAVAAGRNI